VRLFHGCNLELIEHMTRGAVTSTLVCAAFIYACAPRVGIDGGDTDGTPTEKRSATETASPDSGFVASLDHMLDDNTARFAFVVTNYGDGVEVRFPSGLTHDFVVLDYSDREVWRWSEGRLFTQTLQTKQLRAGRSLRYEAKWEDALPGEYRVVATLNSHTHGQSAEARLVISARDSQRQPVAARDSQ
jgi:hypothetical protein